MAIGKEGNVKWVDGLRGFASALVVLTHISRAWAGNLFWATTAENTTPKLLQLPFLRVLIQGRLGVSIFALVTGYVCALKPLKLYRQDKHEAAFISISKSALRRFPRLFLPSAAATVLSFIISELGLFSVAEHADSGWISQVPPRKGSLFPAIGNLVYEIGAIWIKRNNEYDRNQWTMLPLLQESIKIYTFLLAVAYIRPRYRMLASFAMFAYYWMGNDPVFGMLGFWGVLIAELQFEPATARFIEQQRILAPVLSAVLVFSGFYVASYPESHAEWMPWSDNLTHFLKPNLPENPDLPRFSSGIGLMLAAVGIVLSPRLQEILSSKILLFFGKMGFAVYLLHGTLMKTFLAWMIYGISVPADHKDEKGQPQMTRMKYPGHQTLFVCLFFWMPILYGSAYAWTQYVDPWCERMTNKLVEKVKFEETKGNGYIPMSGVQGQGHGPARHAA
ncbi:hypothetical protein PMIN06_009191 [Paraphaeosphaeria minitans]